MKINDWRIRSQLLIFLPMLPTHENPYAAPQTSGVAAKALSESESEMVRNEYIKTEAAIKSIGILYYLGGCFTLLVSVMPLVFGLAFGRIIQIAGGLLLLAFGIALFIVGQAIRRLEPWSRHGATVLSAIGLLAFPVGTVINAYILYLVLAKRSKMIFSAPYREIIAGTPEMKCKTPVLFWFALALVVAFLGILFSTPITD